MGMFDRVYVDCPNCGNQVEFQSKVGECNLANFGIDDAPTHVLMDIMNSPERCQCGTWVAVIDPRAPASVVRPETEVVTVFPPDNPAIVWGEVYWPGDRAFTKYDIEENDQ